MQTFLPYPSYEHSAQVLDRMRLGKQRVEVIQILRALYGHTGGWSHHPAVSMWRGHEPALGAYGVAVCREWIGRGYRDTCLLTIAEMVQGRPVVDPPWLGRTDFHASHRSNLLRKAPGHYGKLGWTEPPDLPYVWP